MKRSNRVRLPFEHDGPKTPREAQRRMKKFHRALEAGRTAAGADAVFALAMWLDAEGNVAFTIFDQHGDLRRPSRSERDWLRKVLTPTRPPRRRRRSDKRFDDDLPF